MILQSNLSTTVLVVSSKDLRDQGSTSSLHSVLQALVPQQMSLSIGMICEIATGFPNDE
jgi:hypothetical protein